MEGGRGRERGDRGERDGSEIGRGRRRERGDKGERDEGRQGRMGWGGG